MLTRTSLSDGMMTGRAVSVCGEMASDPQNAVLLLGLIVVPFLPETKGQPLPE